MKYLVSFACAILMSLCSYGQTASDYFHNSSKQYIDGNNSGAKELLAEGIRKFPNDPKLTSLDELIEEEEPPENQDQQNQQDQEDEGQNQDQENQDQENQNSEDQQQQDQENQEQQNQKQEDQQSQDGQENEKEGDQQEQQQPQEGEDGEDKEQKDDQQAPSPSDKMQEMNISEEKAKMILEALKNSEIQYIQQNRRKPTKRKESDKPDW